jgi:hypothetical protein
MWASSAEEKLHYRERFAYVYNQQLFLHNFTTDRVERIVKIEPDRWYGGICPNRDRSQTQIAFTGLGLVAVIDTTEKDKSWINVRNIHFFDKDLILTKSYSTCPSHPLREWEPIEKCVKHYLSCFEKLNEIYVDKTKSDQFELLTRDQMSAMWIDKDTNDSFFTFTNLNRTIEITAPEKDRKLCLIQKIEPMEQSFDKIEWIFYDKYDGSLIIVMYSLKLSTEGVKYSYTFERWEKLGNEWQYEKSIDYLVNPGNFYNKKIWEISCSKHHIVLSVADQHIITNDDVFTSIRILDKLTFVEQFRLSGCHPIFRDDYDWWRKKSITLLKSINAIEKLSIDILGLILSFVE